MRIKSKALRQKEEGKKRKVEVEKCVNRKKKNRDFFVLFVFALYSDFKRSLLVQIGLLLLLFAIVPFYPT